MNPLAVIEVLGFGFGLLFGSFLNVCISRVPRSLSVVRPGSRCADCGQAIRWYDLVPVVSWAMLRGRCRACGAGISWRYPAVELAMGLWMMWAARSLVQGYAADAQLGRSPVEGWLGAVSLAILGFLLIGLMVMDWQTERLPDAFTLSGLGIGFFLTCAQAIFLHSGEGDIIFDSNKQLRLSSPGSFASQGNVFLTGAEALVFGRMAAIAGAALLLLLVRWGYQALRKREGMGLGDVKMLAMIAAFVGMGETLLALFVGVLTAAVYGVAMLARRRAEATTRLPFGSFLALGGLTAALIGPALVGWYAGLLR